MNKNSNVYQSVKTIVFDKLTEAGKSEAFIEAVQINYLSSIVEVVEEAIDNELEYLIEQSSISEL